MRRFLARLTRDNTTSLREYESFASALFAAIPSSYETVFTFNESEEHRLTIGGRSLALRDVGFLARKRVYS